MLSDDYLPLSYSDVYLHRFGSFSNGFRFDILSESVLAPSIECTVESCNVILKIKDKIVASTIASTEKAQLRWIYNYFDYFGEKYNTRYWFQPLLSELLFRFVIDEKNFLDYFIDCFTKNSLSFNYPGGVKEKEYAGDFIKDIPVKFRRYAYATSRENMELILNLLQNAPGLYKILERTLSSKGTKSRFPLTTEDCEQYFITRFNEEVKEECLLNKVKLILNT